MKTNIRCSFGVNLFYVWRLVLTILNPIYLHVFCSVLVRELYCNILDEKDLLYIYIYNVLYVRQSGFYA